MAHSVVLFHTSSAAFKAEQTLLKAGLAVKLIPTPRQYSSDCGLALQFSGDCRAQVEFLLREATVTVAALHVV